MKSGSKSSYVPDRGDIVKLNFSPQVGHEQAGFRPALILSPAKYNKLSSLALMCPITNQAKGYRFEVSLGEEMQTSGVVLSDQQNNHLGDFRMNASDYLNSIDDRLERMIAISERNSKKPGL